MGISHSMNGEQMNLVLTEFESTTEAIRGIEQKVARVIGYVDQAEDERRLLSSHANRSTKTIESVTDVGSRASISLLNFSTEIFDLFALVTDVVEARLTSMGFQNLPREFRKDLWPLMMPIIILVFIISTSNVFFGFILSWDEDLGSTLTLNEILTSEIWGELGDVGILRPFALAHCSLIGLAVLYLLLEKVRSIMGRRTKKNRKRKSKETARIMAAAARIVEAKEESRRSPSKEGGVYPSESSNNSPSPSGVSERSRDAIVVESPKHRSQRAAKIAEVSNRLRQLQQKIDAGQSVLDPGSPVAGLDLVPEPLRVIFALSREPSESRTPSKREPSESRTPSKRDGSCRYVL